MHSFRRVACAWILAALAMLTVWPAAAQVQQPALAVVETDNELAPLADLLTAQLSQEGVKLVERKQLDAVLQEQALSTAGLTDRANLVKVGRLVRADAFVLLSVEKGEKASLLRVRIAETVHGIRLLDALEAWEPGKVEETGRLLREELQGAVSDLKVPSGKLTAVGLVGFHRVELGADKEWMVRVLQSMLAARLSRQLGVVVLEREDLERLREEKLLTEGEPGGLWGSVVLVDGYLDRAADGGMALAVKAQQAGGATVADVTAPISGNDLDGAVSTVVAGLLKGITAAGPAAAWDARSEAAAFYRKGMLLRDHARWTESRPLMEAAYALQPQNDEYVLAFFEAWSEDDGPVEPASRAALAIQALRRELRPGDFAHNGGLLTPCVLLVSYLCSPYSSASEQAAELNRENRRQMRELLKEGPLAGFYSGWGDPRSAWFAAMDRADGVVPGAEEPPVTALFQKAVMPPDRGGAAASWDERCAAALKAFPIWEIGELPAPASDQAPDALAYLRGLANDTDPIVRFFACWQLVNVYNNRMSYDPDNPLFLEGRPEESQAWASTMMHTLSADLVASGRIKRETLLSMCDGAVRIMDGTQYFQEASSRTARLDLMEELLESAIKAGDTDLLAGLVPVWMLYDSRSGASPQADLRYVKLLERVRAALEPQAADPRIQSVLGSLKQAILRTERYWGRRLRKEGNSKLADSIRAAFPDLAPKQLAPHPPVRILLASKDSRAVASPCVELVDGVLWMCLLDDSSGRKVRLAGLDLRTERVVASWQMDIGKSADAWELAFTGGIAVGPDRIYVATRNCGLIEFPGAIAPGQGGLSAPRLLTEKDGLPSSQLVAVAPFGRKLWVAYGTARNESGLGIYDPVARRYERLFSSTLEESGPFSSGRPYMIEALRATGNDLYFCVGFSDNQAPSGLWRVDGATLKAELCAGGHLASAVSRIDQAGARLSLSGFGQIGEADPHAGAVTWLARTIVPDASPGIWSQRDAPYFPGACGPYPPEDRLIYQLQFFSAAVVGDAMWLTCQDGRIAVLQRGKPLDESELFDWDLLPGDEVCRFTNTPYGLLVIGAHSIGITEVGHVEQTATAAP